MLGADLNFCSVTKKLRVSNVDLTCYHPWCLHTYTRQHTHTHSRHNAHSTHIHTRHNTHSRPHTHTIHILHIHTRHNTHKRPHTHQTQHTYIHQTTHIRHYTHTQKWLRQTLNCLFSLTTFQRTMRGAIQFNALKGHEGNLLSQDCTNLQRKLQWKTMRFYGLKYWFSHTHLYVLKITLLNVAN